MRTRRRKPASFSWMHSSSCALTAVVGAKGLSQMQQRTSRLMWRGMCSFPDSDSEPVGDRALNMSPLLSWDKTLRAPHGTANKHRKERGGKGIEWNSEIHCASGISNPSHGWAAMSHGHTAPAVTSWSEGPQVSHKALPDSPVFLQGWDYPR